MPDLCPITGDELFDQLLDEVEELLDDHRFSDLEDDLLL